MREELEQSSSFVFDWKASWAMQILFRQISSVVLTWVTRWEIQAQIVSSNPALSRSTRSLCDKVYQWLATSQWFSPGTPVSSTNKTYRHDIPEILLKVALNTITITLTPHLNLSFVLVNAWVFVVIQHFLWVFFCFSDVIAWVCCSNKHFPYWLPDLLSVKKNVLDTIYTCIASNETLLSII